MRYKRSRMAFLRAAFNSRSEPRSRTSAPLVVRSASSSSLHAGQRLAKPGLSCLSSNFSEQMLQTRIGKPTVHASNSVLPIIIADMNRRIHFVATSSADATAVERFRKSLAPVANRRKPPRARDPATRTTQVVAERREIVLSRDMRLCEFTECCERFMAKS